MKRLLFFIITGLSFVFTAKAQYVNIPDSNFRNFLKYQYPGCFNVAGQMDTTCADIVNEDTLQFRIYDVSDIDAVRYFKRLRYLDCSLNGGGNMQHLMIPDSLTYFNCSGIYNLVELPPLPQTLQYLICSYLDDIRILPALPAGLKYLDCSNCFRLTEIPPLPSSLKYLNCSLCREVAGLPSLPPFLDTLNCSICNITALPVLPAAIRYLNCAVNPMSSFPAFPDSIRYLDCGGFPYPYGPNDTLTVILPALPSNLVHLNCSEKQIRVMPALPVNLVTLYCRGNLFTSLPTIPASLINLDCGANRISMLPSLPNTLRYLDCSGNPIHNISVFPDSLRSIYCYGDSLSSLPALPLQLDTLHCISNQLTHLPNLPQGLLHLNCGFNLITALPILPASLRSVFCNGNRLSNLPELPNSISEIWCHDNNIHCFPKLPTSGFGLTIEMDGYKIGCLPNIPPYLSLHLHDTTWSGPPLPNELPLCNPTNNSNHCESFPVMNGIVFYDNNSNGIKDADEPIKSNSRVSLSNNNYSFSNNNGYYETGADSIGAYTISATPPLYFNAVPAGYNYNFINYDTLVTNNFALQANTSIDSLDIKINPIRWAARPGFSFPYLVNYENAGTTTLSPNIVFKYDVTRLTYDSSSNVSVVNNGTNISLPVGSFVPGQFGNFIAYFTVKTTALLGDTLFAKATISANGNTFTDSVLSTIRGAFDPNDKQATPQLSPSQVASGKYIDYTIRFQNTGTDTAFNIVISDTLSSDLQASALQMLSSSHGCKATVKDNVVFFEFLNILLPDSNVNESKSHGFVSFRIKPQSNVAENTIIPNKAAIYFDYNSPVITNTATTEIKTLLIPVPLKLQLFTVVKQTENTAIISWNTANEINVAKFYIEQSFDGRNFVNIGNENAKGRQYNSYAKQINIPALEILYFRLKIIDVDGRFTYGPVVALRKNKTNEPFTILNNPVKDILTIAVQDAGLRNSMARVINGQGAVLQTILLRNNTETMDLSKLPAGMYILQTEKGSSSFMLVR